MALGGRTLGLPRGRLHEKATLQAAWEAGGGDSPPPFQTKKKKKKKNEEKGRGGVWNQKERRLCVERKSTKRKRKSEGKEAVGDQLVGGRKEKRENKERKEKKKRKRKRKKKKRKRREPNQRCTVVGPEQARNETALREVSVFLPRFYSTPRGRVMVYGFLLVSGQIYMLCGLFVIVGRSWTKYMSSWDHRGRARLPRT